MRLRTKEKDEIPQAHKDVAEALLSYLSRVDSATTSEIMTDVYDEEFADEFSKKYFRSEVLLDLRKAMNKKGWIETDTSYSGKPLPNIVYKITPSGRDRAAEADTNA